MAGAQVGPANLPRVSVDGLTFGSISTLFGLTHHIVDSTQDSELFDAVIASAVQPALIANAFLVPHHLPTLMRSKEHTSQAAEILIQEHLYDQTNTRCD